MPYPGIYKLTEAASAPTAGSSGRSSPRRSIAHRSRSSSKACERRRPPWRPSRSASSAGPWPACQRATPPSLIAMRRSWSFLTPYVGDAAPHLAWTEMMFEVIRPAATGVYSNFLEDEGEDAFARRTPVRPTTGSPRSSGPTTPRTSSTATRTSARRTDRSPRRQVDGRVARWRPGRFVIRSASSYMRPTTWPSGSAKSAIVVSGATSVSGTITRPPAASTFASTAFGSSAWT